VTRITGILRADHYAFMIISRSVLLKMRNISDELCRQTQNTDICSITFSENIAINVIKWKNIVVLGRPHMRIWRMRIAYWVPKAKNTHSECHTCFPLQHWLHERTSDLLHIYTAVLFCSNLLSVASFCGNSTYWRNIIPPSCE
jgi:hypothetical protein